MLQQIIAYRRIKKHDKILKGFIIVGKTIGDRTMVKNAIEVLYMNSLIKKQVLLSESKAIRYNLECIRHDLD